MNINTDQIRELADLAIEKQLAELIVQDGECSVTIKLSTSPMPYHIQPMLHPGVHPGASTQVIYAPPAPNPVAAISSHGSTSPEQSSTFASSKETADPNSTNRPSNLPNEDKLQSITAPMVGTFYAAPSPDSPPFVSVGQTIAKGQVLCIIEAMKMMNELESEMSGKVVRVLVENGQPVEFGQVLMWVEPL